MKIFINAGHTKNGKGTGANGYLNESVENRKIACELMKLLADTKHEVISGIIDRHDNNLKYIVEQANNSKADLFVSIHLNAGGGTGVEAYTYKGAQHQQAVNICKNLAALGFKNRGVKDGTKYYIVKNTTMKAILIEVCFVDNAKDVELYKQLGCEKIAKAIYDAIV